LEQEGLSISSLSKMKSKNSIIAEHKWAFLNLLLGKCVTLTHEDEFHQLSKCQLIPHKPSSFPIRIKAINTQKSPSEINLNISKGVSQ
jgi:hypothetical protein